MKRRGAATVEFAVVAPVFFLLIFGMIEYGRMVMVQQLIVNASREGARQSVLENATTSSVETAVNDYLATTSLGNATSSVTVTPAPQTATRGDNIAVTVTLNFASVSWLPSPMFLGAAELSATSVMRREAMPTDE